MSSLVSRPTVLALSLSFVYGHYVPQPDTALIWFPCPECARYRGQRMTLCRTCGGSGRFPVMPS